MKSHFSKFVLLFLLPLFAISLIQAQETASITGSVSDPTGAVIPDVLVILTNPATGNTYRAKTNSLGSYIIAKVLPGPGYSVAFTRTGFRKTIITDLYLNVGTTRTQNATLNAGGDEQTVTVSGGADTVTLNTIDATVGANFQPEFLNNLPVGNRDSPSALFTLQPGVNSAGSVTGARVDQTSVTVDGLDVNDAATGSFGGIVGTAPVDSVQEFRSTTAGMTSSSSMGGGGHFDLVTKNGTNAFHGAVVEYFRDRNTAANSWFNNNSGVGRAPYHRNQFGGELGGPIKRNKAFFYFDYDGRRDTLSDRVLRAVPTKTFKSGLLGYRTKAGGTSYIPNTVFASQYDPAHVGFDQALLALFNARYPDPNSADAGNGYNTSGFRFNDSYNLKENVFVGRFDYNLTDKQKLFARFTIERIDTQQSDIQFPGDPLTAPQIVRSRAWVIGHTWAINDHMTNNATWGQTVAEVHFPNTYNPQGITQNTFGLNKSGGTIIDQPYASAVNAQGRIYPIPVLRDEFNWVKGRHSFQFGGTFKYVNPNFYQYLAYNEPSIGMGGYLTSSLDATMYPADVASTNYPSYDAAFTTALGHYSNQTSVYNYDLKGNVMTQGTAQQQHYRYYETELYFEDSWKATPNLTITYGVNWASYTVPYEKNGLEAAASQDFDTFWGNRLAQSKAGKYGDNALPFVSYDLSGKSNNKPSLYNPTNKNFGPHVAFSYTPSFDRKSVFSVGAGVDFDHTVVSALLYQQSQHNFLFQQSSPYNYAGDGVSHSATHVLNDANNRFNGISSPVQAIPNVTMTHPFTPYVDSGSPWGLNNGQAFNTAIDKNFKTPYSINISAGYQHEFSKGFLWKVNYVGRLGRRLMAQADANQLIDFPDTVSGQTMLQAIVNLEGQIRTGTAAGKTYGVSSSNTVTNVPWIENLVGNYYPGTFKSSTAEVAYFFHGLLNIGDFADTVQGLTSFAPSNVGMGAQFSEFTYYTNKGFSNYHGLLTTLHKNAGYGLQFDINYTWSKSIDNVSATANTIASSGYGFICDINRPRECRAPSDFDNRQVITGNIVYELPFGRKQAFASAIPLWADEVIGGWSLSALPTWRTGFPYFATSNAFVAGYANNAPAVLTGNIANMKPSIHKDAAGSVWMYKDVNAALSSYQGPTGFDIGSRNNVYGTHYTNFDLGLGKYFQIYKDKAKLQFRCDAFNAFNHPTFADPSSSHQDITQSTANFGQVTGTDSSARVLQGSLRLEF